MRNMCIFFVFIEVSVSAQRDKVNLSLAGSKVFLGPLDCQNLHSLFLAFISDNQEVEL